MHSRTMQDILANTLKGNELGFYFSHGHPIPESHNICVEEALRDKPEYIWLCEDDMAYPYDILDKMIEADVDLAVADYPVGIGRLPCIKYHEGQVLYAGVGCVLVKPWVFEKIGEPYFSTDTIYDSEMNPVPNNIPNSHGLHDVDFWVRARKLNPTIKVVGNVGHYKLKDPFPNDIKFNVEKWEL